MNKPEEKRPWPKLPTLFRKKWTKALRSGDFAQSSQTLYNRTEDGFCCLGLAAHLCGVEKVELSGCSVLGKTSGGNFDMGFDAVPESVPKCLIGTAQNNPLVKQLAGMNDGNGMPREDFKTIADWIDENLS